MMLLFESSDRINRYNRFISLAVGLGSFTYGYCSSVIASTIGQPGWYEYFHLPLEHQPGYSTTTTQAIATANGLYSTGGALGSLFIMWSAQVYGRKSSMQLGAALALLGGVLQGGAAALPMFHLGRVLAGIGIGILVTVCPMYLAELSAAPVRGVFMPYRSFWDIPSLAGLGMAVISQHGLVLLLLGGSRFSSSASPLCSCLSARYGFRDLPAGYCQKDAWAVLQRLRSVPGSSDDSMALKEFHEIREQIRLEEARLASTGHNSWLAAWTKKSYRKRMFLGFLTQWGAEFAGPLVIVGR
ncbi:sugar transporter protein [Rutstroemia sp. NJR-2017a BBW]|nr:sugar transporter protein [Rutstroemia sp. NJR-2017a BBW]